MNMPTMQAKPETVWDGKKHSYRPDANWRSRVDPKLKIFEDCADDLDPITYEVIRNRLWTINISHGETLTRISGSPVFQVLDFNMCLLTGDGETLMNAPYIQFLNGGATYGIRYILERYSGSPGINDGDIFVGNDPWVSAAHQMDVQVSVPVFVNGQLFAWVSSAGHQYDMGGISPGGWPQGASDVFSDPVILPHFKMVERGQLRKDLEHLYLRQSRMPQMVSLDLKAALTGGSQARDAIVELCRQFGPATVRAAMKRIGDQSQQAMKDKLKRLPDGTWSEVRFSGDSSPGDRTIYRIQVNVTKKGDRLIIDNQGTDPQTGWPNGITYSLLVGSTMTVVGLNLLYEQMFAFGGAERQLDFDVEPGLLNTVDYPSAVSGGVSGAITNLNIIQSAVAKMLACNPELKRDVLGTEQDLPFAVFQGVDDRGNPYGQALLDGYIQGRGAQAFSDGIDNGGPLWVPIGRLLNIESTEQWYPLIYLYRRISQDSAGAGRWRGGNGGVYAVTSYRAASASFELNSQGVTVTVSNATGLGGGYPTPALPLTHAQNTNLQELFAKGQIPTSLDQLEGQIETMRGKVNSTPFGKDDILEIRIGGGGGYGDPLDREPARVRADVAQGFTSREYAASVYGVVINDDGEVNEGGTSEARREVIETRKAWQQTPARFGAENAPAVKATGEPAREVHECVESCDRDGFRILACKRCGHRLGGYRDQYKIGLNLSEEPMMSIHGAPNPAQFVDPEIVFRRFCCPGCQVLMATEVARKGDPIVEDFRFA